jgi:hypothetical protein
MKHDIFNSATTAAQVAKGMALAFFAHAFRELKDLRESAGDSVTLPEVIDPAAEHAAFTLACDIRISNDATDLAQLYERARDAHRIGEGSEDMTPAMFGHYLTMQSLGLSSLEKAFGARVSDAIHVPHVQFGAYALERDYSDQM